jgi:hypothetical protein
MIRAILAATAALGVSGGHVTDGGRPVFPVLGYFQCGAGAAQAAAAGIDFFIEQPYTGCWSVQPNNFATEPLPPGVRVLSDDFTTASEGSAGWYLPDEPDGAAISPAELPQLPPVSETGRLRVLTVSQHFFSAQALIRPGYDLGEYGRFAAKADVVGFDLYPVVKFCGRVPLLDVFRAQRELRTLYAVGKPTFQWIETGAMTGECQAMTVTPEIANAEAWLAVAGGAVGIGWFTSSWIDDVWNRWDVSPAMLAQITATNARLHALAPVLTGPPGDVVVPWNGPVAASTRADGRSLYVIAVNGSDRRASVPMRIDGLRGRVVTVLDEHRTIKPTKKSIVRDTFAPYQVHLYATTP